MPKYFRFEMVVWSVAWSRTHQLVLGDWRKLRNYFGISVSTVLAWLLLGGPAAVTNYFWGLEAVFFGAGMYFLAVLAWQLVTAPYKIWRDQQSEIKSLNIALSPVERRLKFEVGNADEYLQSRGTYMFKITNYGDDSSTCLARLLGYTQDENEQVVNTVLPTRRQWEETRSGRFNLSKDESKYVMLIGRFPDGWYFLLEGGIQGPLQLESPILAEVAILGCGDKASTTIIIELLDEETRLLRLTQDK